MAAATLTKPKRRKQSNFGQDNLVGYLFIGPWLAAFVLFTFIPITVSLISVLHRLQRPLQQRRIHRSG